MSNLLEKQVLPQGDEIQYLTIFIADQMFGIPVTQVRDIFRLQQITTIPLTDDDIAGAINLRGRIVTAIDLRKRLGVDATVPVNQCMNVAVEYKDELYSLIVDRVGEVILLGNDSFEQSPATLNQKWKKMSSGIHKLEERLLIVLNVGQILGMEG
jgi:purine-binding chemotaxis protein CheW